MKKLIVIADWASDTVACQEVRSMIDGFVRNPEFVNVSFVVAEDSTAQAGQVLKQLVSIEERFGRSLETVFFLDVNPKDAGVSEFIIVRLTSGMYICGMNVEHNFSYIKDEITNVFRYTVPEEDKTLSDHEHY